MKLMNQARQSALIISLLAPASLQASDVVQMEGMSVIGNKESPNLLYIVPWKTPRLPKVSEPVSSSRLFDEALEPVEREVLIREELYREARQQIYNP